MKVNDNVNKKVNDNETYLIQVIMTVNIDKTELIYDKYIKYTSIMSIPDLFNPYKTVTRIVCDIDTRNTNLDKVIYNLNKNCKFKVNVLSIKKLLNPEVKVKKTINGIFYIN